MSDLKSLSRWKRENRKFKQVSNNGEFVRYRAKNVKPQCAVDAMIVDLVSGEFSSYAELGRKHGMCTITIKRYEEKCGVKFKRKVFSKTLLGEAKNRIDIYN